MKFTNLFATFMVASLLVTTMPMEAKRRNTNRRHTQVTQQAPQAAANQNRTQAGRERRVKMTKEQLQQVRFQRVIRNGLFLLGGAVVMYLAERNFNIIDKLRDLLTMQTTMKNTVDLGKRVVNGLQNTFVDGDLTGGAAKNDGTFLGEGFYN